MQKIYFLIIGVVVVLLIGGVGFLLLHKNSSPSDVLSANNSSQNVADQRFGGGAPAGRGFRDLPAGSKPIFGQITSIADNKLTVQGMSGDLNVSISDSTKYTGGTKSDLKIDDRIVGYGTANSDGSITAQELTINPSFPRRGDAPNPQSNTNSL